MHVLLSKSMGFFFFISNFSQKSILHTKIDCLQIPFFFFYLSSVNLLSTSNIRGINKKWLGQDEKRLPFLCAANLIPRVLRLFGQWLVARRNSVSPGNQLLTKEPEGSGYKIFMPLSSGPNPPHPIFLLRAITTISSWEKETASSLIQKKK